MKKKRFFRGCELPGLKKLLLVMKLTSFLLFISIMAIAAESYTQNTRFDLNVKNASIIQVLEEIEQQTEYGFLFQTDQLDLDALYTLDFKDTKIESVLNKILDRDLYSYRIMDRIIIISKYGTKSLAGDQNEIIVIGTVTDHSGQPLPGVTVVLKGTTQGTTTNSNGEYLLRNIPDNAMLVYSFVGMRTQEIEVGGRTTINVSLETETIGIEEVVAIGYGTQKKVNLTGAVDVISNEKLVNRSAPTVSQLLQGVSPGINLAINNQDGFHPGAEMDISIRGMGSLNGGKPYILVDGVPGDINNLNPEDIESISVLKDAAASAIYGARAPYGVILITTKRGKKDKKLSVTYSGTVMLNTPPPLREMVDSYTWTRTINEAGKNRGGSPFSDATIDRIIAFQNGDFDYIRESIPDYPEGADITTGAYPLGNTWDHAQLNFANNDWWDIYFRNSVNHKHNLSVQGGTDKASYYFSAGYIEQDGVMRYGVDSFDRKNLLGKINLSIADWWDFEWETRFAQKNREEFNGGQGGSYSSIMGMMSSVTYPISPIYDGWGHYTQTSTIPMIEDGGTNINEELENWQIFKTILSPLKGWKINADFAYNSYSRVFSSVRKNIKIYNVDKTYHILGSSVPNSVERIHNDNRYWTTNIYSSYDISIKDSHNFGVLVGMQFEKGNNRQLRGYKTDLIVEDVASLETATGSAIVNENLSHRATQGYFSRVSYNFKEKYILESNVRYDGSYVFREGNRWGFFPSFSLGWNVHKESFWNIPEKYITTLKLRGSWGQLGNQNVSPYSDLGLIPINSGQLNWIFNYGGSKPVGYTQAPNIVNRNLTWETATTKNIGTNITLFNNKLEADFDFFERETTEMVGPSEAKPGVLGANMPQENNSSLRTRGWELALNWRQSLSNGISYFVNLNLFDYKSVVKEYFNPTGTLTTWAEGREVGEIWGYTVNDLFRSQEEVDNYLSTTDLSFIYNTWRPGDVKYEDTSGDNKVNNGKNTLDDHGDLSIIGNSEPHWQYGISAGMNYKGIDFSMLWKGVAKKDIYFSNGSNMFWGYMHGWWETQIEDYHLDYFRDVPGTKYVGLYEGEANINTDAYWPRPYLNNPENRKNKAYPNTRYLQDASYLRLQNVQLGYTIPAKTVSKLHLQSLRIYFSGENLLTFSDLPRGIDPVAPVGFPRGGNFEGVRGTGRFTYGADRIYSLGLTITY